MSCKSWNQRPSSEAGVLRTPGTATDLADICRQAVEAGHISQEEDDELFRADLVIQGRKEGEPIYVVIEASVAAGAHDFDRADQRAAILSKAISDHGPDVHSVVVSDSLQDEVDTSNYRAPPTSACPSAEKSTKPL